jgi:hypothetical protein
MSNQYIIQPLAIYSLLFPHYNILLNKVNNNSTNNSNHTNQPNYTTSHVQSSSADPHNTRWSEVSIPRFIVLMSLFSTVENAIFYPFYVLKTREQADRNVTRKPGISSSKYHLQYILRTQGIRGLYKGFWSSCFVSLPAYGVYMAVYTAAKDKLGYNASERNGASFYAPFVAGLIADAASVALYVPGDVVVQRLQIASSPYKSFLHACKEIYKNEGLKGFFQGFGATFLTSGIASAIWWCVYENTKNFLYKHSNSKEISEDKEVEQTKNLWEAVVGVNRIPQIVAGFTAGTITSTIINPLDVVKTRLQTQDTGLITINPPAIKEQHKAHKQTQPTTTPISTTLQHHTAKSTQSIPPTLRSEPISISVKTTALFNKNAAANTDTAAPINGEVKRASSIQAIKLERPYRYKNVLDGLVRIYAEEGVHGYFRGVVPKLISRGPLSAMSSLLYELVLYCSRKDLSTSADKNHQQRQQQFA